MGSQISEELPPDFEQAGDEWSLTDLATMNFIATSRLYDVMMALLMDADLEKGQHLLKLHLDGGLLMPAPSFDGNFVSTEVNNGPDTPG